MPLPLPLPLPLSILSISMRHYVIREIQVLKFDEFSNINTNEFYIFKYLSIIILLFTPFIKFFNNYLFNHTVNHIE